MGSHRLHRLRGALSREAHIGFRGLTAESGKRDYSRPLLSEPDVKVSLHPAQASRRPCEGPVSSKRPAGCTILDRSRCPYGEGSTSGTRPPTFATPSVPIPPWFSCRDTAGKSARLRVRSCCTLYPSHYRTAFALSPPHTRTAIGLPYGFPTFLPEGTVWAYHVPQG